MKTKSVHGAVVQVRVCMTVQLAVSAMALALSLLRKKRMTVMTQNEIIEIAKEAGMDYLKYISHESFEKVIAFAKLVSAKEREACAKICEEMRDAWVNRPVPLLGYAVEHDGAAKAIRARGEA